MKLPTEFHKPDTLGIPKDFTMIVFGPPKVGKTTFGASWPNSLLVECEPRGADYVECRKVDINSLSDLREVYMVLKNDNVFETVVIDSLDRVAYWIEEAICAELGIPTIFDAKKGERHGAQWGLYSQKVLTFLESWKALGKRVIFLAHTKKAESDGNGTIINPKTINLYGSAAGRVMALVENIGHLYAQEDAQGSVVRYLSFKAGSSVEAGSRHPALRDKVITLPLVNPYGAFEALFDKPKAKAVKKQEVAA